MIQMMLEPREAGVSSNREASLGSQKNSAPGTMVD
jgi:hypothetical protein